MTKDEIEIITRALEAMRDAYAHIDHDGVRNNLGRAIVDLEEAINEQ
jgi:hypothetical protein